LTEELIEHFINLSLYWDRL